MKKLAIVVGHTHNNMGAKMAPPYDFISEYEFNTVLAGMLVSVEHFEIECKVFLRDLDGYGCYDRVKEFGADAAIELHFNSADNLEASGHEVLYGPIPNSEKLAFYINKSIKSIQGEFEYSNDRGIKILNENSRGWKSVSNSSGAPTVIIEPFFGSNVNDCIGALYFMSDLRSSIFGGIEEFFESLEKEPE